MAKASTKIRKADRRTPAAPQPAFEATPERIAQANDNTSVVDATIDKAGERKLKTRRFTDSQIDRMFRSKRITYAQWFAAGWYLEQYEQAGFGGRVTANYNPTTSASGLIRYGLPSSERQARHRHLWRQAREAVPANMLHLIDQVVLHDIVPAFRNGQQGQRFGAAIGKALQPMAEWLNAPEETERNA
jgi:hypothetical protein